MFSIARRGLAEPTEDTIRKTIGRSLSATLESAARIMPVAAWFGVLTGLGEVSILAVVRLFPQQYIPFFGPPLIWMAPLADLFGFLCLGIALSMADAFSRGLISLRVTTLVFSFVSFASLLFLVPAIDSRASLVLALGLAVQSSSIITAHSKSFYSIVRRMIGWPLLSSRSQDSGSQQKTGRQEGGGLRVSRRQFLFGSSKVIVGLAAGVHGWERLAEARALSILPAPPEKTPNVLLIVLDTVRARNLSLYGYSRATSPQMEKLATTGVRFDRAISTAPWTLPSHASMFTGRFPHEMSAGIATPLDATYPTLAEALGARGYLTAGFVANLEYCGQASGLARGFQHYEDFSLSPAQFVASASLGRYVSNEYGVHRVLGHPDDFGRKRAPEINDSFLRWLSGSDPRRPFFAFLNYFDAHSPYVPPAPFDSAFGSYSALRKPRLIPRPVPQSSQSQAEIQAEMDAYDGSTAYVDDHVGQLLRGLESRGVLGNSLVIVTSDHGEEFGEHGAIGHGISVYLPSLHVPLLISFPRQLPSGIHVGEPVSLRDLPATVLDILGTEDAHGFPGSSLARYWDPGRSSRTPPASFPLSELDRDSELPDWYPVAHGNMKSLVVDNYHYIRRSDGEEELFGIENDLLDTHDLGGTEAGRIALKQCRDRLDTILSSHL